MSCSHSMIVNDLDARWTFGRLWPFKTYPPLLIDADRILARSVASQRFQPIAWKPREIGQGQGRIENFKSFPALPIKALERSNKRSLRKELRAFVPEA